MRILQVHNAYKQRGGEDVVVEAEKSLLRTRGHNVRLFSVSNDSIGGILKQIKTAFQSTYSQSMRKRFESDINSFLPDVVHAHNLFPLVTPSIYDACRDAKIPVVQTLHNYRLICAGALFMRNEMICEDCLHSSAYRSVFRRCYRHSILGTLAVAKMIEYHRKHNTWKDKVDCFIALTDFARSKFIAAGFPANKIIVKSNFTVSENVDLNHVGKYALYVGRLSKEKGIHVLLDAWRMLDGILPLKIVGDGPLRSDVTAKISRLSSVEFLGPRPREDVMSIMKNAMILIFPSIWYEGFPLTIVESYSVGLPVLAGNLGSMSSLIQNGRTGLHFRSGDSEDLVSKVLWTLSNKHLIARMKREARREFEDKYSVDRNYEHLINIYTHVVSSYGV